MLVYTHRKGCCACLLHVSYHHDARRFNDGWLKFPFSFSRVRMCLVRTCKKKKLAVRSSLFSIILFIFYILYQVSYCDHILPALIFSFLALPRVCSFEAGHMVGGSLCGTPSQHARTPRPFRFRPMAGLLRRGGGGIFLLNAADDAAYHNLNR